MRHTPPPLQNPAPIPPLLPKATNPLRGLLIYKSPSPSHPWAPNMQHSLSAGPSKPMYPSPHRPTGPPLGLARYGSAPGSLLASIAESVVSSDFPSPSTVGSGGAAASGSGGMMSRFFSGDSSCLSSESTCKPSPSDPRPYALDEIAAVDPRPPQLIRHSSSPAGFFSHLMVDNGYPITRGLENYSHAEGNGVHAMQNRRLQSQLSFSREDSLSQISGISLPDIADSIGNGKNSDDVSQTYIPSNFTMGSWDETNSIVFSASPSKRHEDNNGDVTTELNAIDSQFGLPKTSLDMAAVEKLLQSQQDYVPFKVRAKRGCATHPRSIAERERRTRISEKLRKLQELVPNMDKQTNTADMLDLAVQHIKTLQSQVQKLSEEQADCKCGCKPEKL